MIGFILRRLAIAIVLLWIVSVVTFFLYLKVPEDPASFVVDVQHATPAQIAEARHALGVDAPVTTQYAKFVWRALHGDFGTSWATVSFFSGEVVGEAVGPMVWDAAKVTASLAVGGLVLMLLVAIPLGTLAAARPRSWLDRISIALGLAAISTHPLVIALLLQLFLGNRWEIAPASGYCPLFGSAPEPPPPGIVTPTGGMCGGPAEWATHLLLPWATFALFFVALYMRVARARMLEVLEEPYIRTARAKGASELRVVGGHALRNGISPIVTMIAMDAGLAIGIAMYVETVFGLPGLGRTTIYALGNQQGIDLPVILAVTLVAAAAVILLNLVVDLVLVGIDPRITRGGARADARTGSAAAA
ncbi:MAG TPA: ABC transporter permease [Gaiellaceae bacterium]|nr:ABC transporter permease [Gaiellaceae bacterium]